MLPPPVLRRNPPVASRCGRRLLSLSADGRSTDDVIACTGTDADRWHIELFHAPNESPGQGQCPTLGQHCLTTENLLEDTSGMLCTTAFLATQPTSGLPARWPAPLYFLLTRALLMTSSHAKVVWWATASSLRCQTVQSGRTVASTALNPLPPTPPSLPPPRRRPKRGGL